MLRKILGAGRAVVKRFDSSDGSDSDSESKGGHEQSECEGEVVAGVDSSDHAHCRAIGEIVWSPPLGCRASEKTWIWAGHVARRTDGRWSKTLLDWIPAQGTRRQRRPDLRWEDDMDVFFKRHFQLDKGLWKEFAQDRRSWEEFADDFLSFSF